MELGQRIKAARKSKGLTQEQLAKKCNLATITIRQYELGKRKPSITQLAELAQILGVNFDTLIGLETFESPEDFHKEWERITSQPRGEEVTVIHKAVGEVQIIDHQKEKLLSTYELLDREDRKSLVRHGELLASQPKYRESDSLQEE